MCVHLKTLAKESNVLPASTVPYPALQAAPRLCERIRPTYRTVLLLPYYSTRCLPSLLSQRLGQVGLCQIPRPQAAPRPMLPPHAASRAAMAVDDHLGAPTVGGGCSRVAADVACRPDSEQMTLPQGRSSASSLPAKPTQPPTPTPTGSRPVRHRPLAPGGRQHRSEPRARRGGLRGLRQGGGAREGCS